MRAALRDWYCWRVKADGPGVGRDTSTGPTWQSTAQTKEDDVTKRDVCEMLASRALLMVSDCLRLLAEGSWGAADWCRHATIARRFAELAISTGLAAPIVESALGELRRAYDNAVGEMGEVGS